MNNANEMEFCHVPAGPFMMGDPAVETPLEHEYWMGRYPVTNAQWNIYASTGVVRHVAADRDMHPVTSVSWHDAIDYCRWATGQRTDGRIVGLPTEQEWEKAARGGLWLAGNATNLLRDRVYPWGNDWRTECANVESSGTTCVDAHPNGVSPYGCMDMAGNVWEWTSSDWDATYKVVRGGSWGALRSLARCVSRFGDLPGYRLGDLGFRVVLRGPPATLPSDPLPSDQKSPSPIARFFDDGGPAFPGEQGHTPMGWNQTWNPGMSLRAYLAGQAMAGDFAAQNEYVGKFMPECDYKIAAKRWLQAADAVIAALKEPK